jgi:hypothetical protein
MGYTTYFSGSFTVSPPLTPEQVAYINAFAESRHMKRDISIVATQPDPVREAVGLPLGIEGEYFIGELTGMEQGILAHNDSSRTQPGLWCQWIVSDDGEEIEWDGGEKFYCYTQWLAYICKHFLKPWGRTIKGQVSWEGEESDDQGVIYARGLEVEAVTSVLSNPGPTWGLDRA